VVEFVTGNLLDAEVDALVNTVNTKGVMGKGVALQFRRAFPENYKAYRAACAAGHVELGRMFVFHAGRLERPRFIINFPTKAHWKSRSRLTDVETGLLDLRRVIIELDIQSVALPPLGCGLGGLRWSDVRPRIADALADLPVRALVFEPHGAPVPERMPERRERPRMTAFRATLIWLLGRYLAPGESASPLEVQKLLYFLQEAGEPLRLTFAKQRYGPYADAARHAVERLEGHHLTGFGDGTGPGDVRLLPGAIEEAEAFLKDHPDTLERYERVAELIDGFETPYGLELLATTHWVAVRDRANDPCAAAKLVREWSQRKGRLFTDEHVAVAWRRLEEGGWLAGARVPAGV
jgi:O-acetyl-ADP-ribose deacetylase (regulator of RNase III)